MYIQPNSTIQIMRGVPLNPNYKDTIFFNQGEQSGYFDNYVAYTFTKQYYQRVNKNKCRLDINAEQVYDCNYMRFRNDSFGIKDFYAFITNVEYINHNVTEITYEIDVLQTWAFEYELGACFVEREHTVTDTIGAHILPEPIEVGEYVVQDIQSAGFNETSLYLFVSEPVPGSELTGTLYDGIYSSMSYQFECNAIGAVACDRKIRDIISSSPGGLDSIIGLFIGPKEFPPREYYPTPKTEIRTVAKPNDNTTIKGYLPNNKKLLTAPFYYLEVDSLNDSKPYFFEFFGDVGECVFSFIGSSVGNASIICVPSKYKCNNEGHTDDYTEQVVLGGYPMCIIPVDSVKNWLANNGVYHVLTGLGATGMAVAGLTTGNVYMAGAGITGMVTNFAKTQLETRRANSSRGTVSTSINVQNKSKDFYFKTMCVTYEKARSIDDFFSRYGYTCERVKVPNRAVRKRWTYTKTHNCIVNGNLPADDKQKISSIFDNGITFWTTAGNVGDYVMTDNGVVG